MREKINQIVMRIKAVFPVFRDETEEFNAKMESARVTSTKLKALSTLNTNTPNPSCTEQAVQMNCTTVDGLRKAKAKLTYQRLSALEADI